MPELARQVGEVRVAEILEELDHVVVVVIVDVRVARLPEPRDNMKLHAVV